MSEHNIKEACRRFRRDNKEFFDKLREMDKKRKKPSDIYKRTDI